MATTLDLEKIKTITLDELSSLFEKADFIESKEDLKGFVTHHLSYEGNVTIILPSPNDQVFFAISE